MRRKTICWLLSLLMVLSILNLGAITVNAVNKSADDAIAWCKSKVGKKIDLDGYPKDQPYQCADFAMAYYDYLLGYHVSGNGEDYATNNKPDTWIRTKGGKPQKGDILVYVDDTTYVDSNGITRPRVGHVAIYESDYSTYHQNFNGPYVENITGTIYTKTCRSTAYYWGCIHPDFRDCPAPTNATLSIDKSAVKAGEPFTFTMTADQPVSYYWFTIIRADSGETVISEAAYGTYTTTFLSCDHYIAWCSAANSKGAVDSNRVDFYVYNGAPTSATLSIDNPEVKVGNPFTFTMTSDQPTSYYWFTIIRASSGEAVISEAAYGTYTTSFLSCDHYIAWCSAANDNGAVDSNRVDFYVFGDAPTEGYMVPSSESIRLGESIQFSFSSNAYYTRNYVSIFSPDGVKCFEGWQENRFSFTPNSVGKYNAYASLYTPDGGVDTPWVSFNVNCNSHSWDSGSITTPATCCSTGVKTFTCTVCNATKTETIPKDENNHTGGTEIRNAISATCGKDGYTGESYCKGCGVRLSSGTVVAASGNHAWNDGEITIPATCSAEGVETLACSVCRQTKTEPIAKDVSNHSGGTELKNVKAATCTEAGFTGDTYCKGCGSKLSSGASIPATGHSYGGWIVVKDATCTEKGSERRVCANDSNHIETREIASLGHGETEIRNIKAASCAETGYTGDTYCKVCNTKIADGVTIAPNGHNDINNDGICDICRTVLKTPEIPTTQSTTLPPTEPMTVPISEPTTQPTTAPVTEPMTQPTAPTSAPTTRTPAAEPVTAPMTTAPATTAPTTNEPATVSTPEEPTLPEKIFLLGVDGISSTETPEVVKYASKAALTKSELVAAITAGNDGAEVTVRDKDGNELADDATPGTGSTVTVTVGDATVTKTIILLGDVDGDGVVNASDARLALRAAAKLDTLEGPYAAAADTDGDNTINATDARGILRAAAKLDVLKVA